MSHLEPPADDHHLAKLTDAVESARLRDRTIGALMTTDVVTCTADDTLERAAHLMWTQSCGCVPVVDEHYRPIAMLTDRDVCMAAYTQGLRLADMKVASAMSSRLFVTAPTEPLEDAERRMRCHALHRLPVVNVDGKLVGVLSIDDIARSAHLPHEGDPDALSATALAITAAGLAHAGR